MQSRNNGICGRLKKVRPKGAKFKPNGIQMKKQMQVFRTPDEYLNWFDSLVGTAKRVGEDKRNALLHKGPYKVFYEEIFPTASLLCRKSQEWKSSRFRNIFGNQKYDVEVQNNPLNYIEITCTDFDDGERFRMLKFLDMGHVSAAGTVLRDDKYRPLDIDEDARCTDEVVDERLNLIVKAINKKVKKEYPDKTGLLVYFDDFSTILRDCDIVRLRDALKETRSKWTAVFEAVFLVGPRGEVLIEDKR